MTNDKSGGLKAAFDYGPIFERRTLFITGTARSGTTLTGRIMGSLSPCIYVHEPVVLKLAPALFMRRGDFEGQGADLLRACLFEDFVLPVMHGRGVNFNPLDLSCVENYEPVEAVKARWERFRRRADVIEFLETQKLLFVIKMPELQPMMRFLQQVFPTALFISLIRNGNDMVGSCLKRRGWFSDGFMTRQLIDWVDQGGAPWFLGRSEREEYGAWSGPTRAAAFWRAQVRAGLEFARKNPETCLGLKYEDLIKGPQERLERMIEFVRQGTGIEVSPTDLTAKHLASIQTYDYLDYPDMSQELEAGERDRFLALQRELGYG